MTTIDEKEIGKSQEMQKKSLGNSVSLFYDDKNTSSKKEPENFKKRPKNFSQIQLHKITPELNLSFSLLNQDFDHENSIENKKIKSHMEESKKNLFEVMQKVIQKPEAFATILEEKQIIEHKLDNNPQMKISLSKALEAEDFVKKLEEYFVTKICLIEAENKSKSSFEEIYIVSKE